MNGPRLLGFILLVGQLATPSLAAPEKARVVVGSLDVFDGPDSIAFLTDRLPRGTRVTVRGVQEDGWLAIVPPPGSFSWIEQDAIEDLGNGQARVVAERAEVRPGRPNARVPGAPRSAVDRGATVRLLDRRPLRLRRESGVQVWRAIQPPPGESRYVRAEGTNHADSAQLASRRESEPREAPAMSTTARAALLKLGPRATDAPLDPEFATTLADVERLHKEALQAPVEQWRLGPIRIRYQALLDAGPGATETAVVRERLAQLASQERLVKEAKAFEVLIAQSRRRDLDLDRIREHIEPKDEPGDRPFDARGLLQPSAKEFKGERVHALIGLDGDTLAYLILPTGLRVQSYFGKRIGVRGSSRYNESLGAKVITVTDVERVDGD